MTFSKLISVAVEERESGLFIATSADEPGFFLAVTSAAQIAMALPVALEDLFRRQGKEAFAFPVGSGDFKGQVWAIVPKTLVVKGMERAPLHDQG